MDMKVFLQYFIIIILIISCNDRKKELTKSQNEISSNTLKIPLLEKQGANSIHSGTLQSIRSLEVVPSFLKGVPKADTLKTLVGWFATSKKLTKLYNDGIIDSIKYPKDSLKYKIYAINGYKGNQQFLVIDANNNSTFADDTLMFYKKDFKDSVAVNKDIAAKIPWIDVIFDDFDGERVFKRKYKVKLLPWKSPYHKILSPEQLKKISKRQLDNIFDANLFYKIHWEGSYTFNDNQKYVYVFEGFNEPRFFFRDQPKLDLLQTSTPYRIKDTVLLGDNYYRIDSISIQWDTLSLRKLAIDSPVWGYRKDEKTVNFDYTNIKGEGKVLLDLLKDKEFVLMDYWGTWCAPCKELTPDLKNIDQQYGDFTSILSLAYDREKEPVLDYIEENGLDWEHIFLEGNAKNGKEKRHKLIKNYAIEAYPTFILIDKDLNIIARGTGRKGLQGIYEVLENVRANKNN